MFRILTVVCAILIIGCESNSSENITIPEGTYTGFFLRTTSESALPYSNVTLVFRDNTFAGTTDKVKYPDICSGDYKIAGKEIEFNAPCATVSGGDQTYALSGKFKVAIIGNDLLLTRTYEDKTRDIYRLTRNTNVMTNAAGTHN